MAKWPPGVRPSGRGIRVRIWRKGRLVHSETIEGNPHSKADLASAVKYRDTLISRLKLGLSLTPEDDEGIRLFEDVAQDYLNTHVADEDTVTKYANMLNRHWMPHYAGWPVTEITAKDIKARLAEMEVSIKTKKNVLGPLRGVLVHAEINPNPAAGIRFKKRQKPPVERYRPHERATLLGHLSGQDKVYFALLFATGLRPGEACGLLWEDYDGEQLSVTKQITRGKLKASTKTYERRRVYVPKWVRPLLNNHATRFKEGHIFLNTEGGPVKQTRYFNRAWKKAHKKARVAYRVPYTCRHTRAAELLSIGINPADAASQMGHSTEMFLRTYSEFIQEYAQDQSFDRFEVTDKKPTKSEEDGSQPLRNMGWPRGLEP